MDNGVEDIKIDEPVIVTVDPTTTPITEPPTTSPVEVSIPNNQVVEPTSFSSAPEPTIVTPEEVNNTITPETTPVIVPTTEVVVEKPKKKRSKLTLILFIILIVLGVYIYFDKTNSMRTIDELKYTCSPLTESKGEVNLDINSTLVQDLYKNVATSLREDLAQPEFDDTMKIYLAYRQIPEYKKYDSNCNYWDNKKMEPYTCEKTNTFTPLAFPRSTLEIEWKKLFGETTPMPLINVKLKNTCIGGYQYIAERDEYVQGYCKSSNAGAYKVTKKIVDAKYSNNMIVITEDVQYSGQEDMKLPEYLKSGKYFYTFRLDINYNFVLISKEYDQKY